MMLKNCSFRNKLKEIYKILTVYCFGRYASRGEVKQLIKNKCFILAEKYGFLNYDSWNKKFFSLSKSEFLAIEHSINGTRIQNSISFVVDSKNFSEKLLKQTLSSLKNQIYKNFSLLFIVSESNSEKILQLAGQYGFNGVKIITTSLSENYLNRALAEVSTQYVSFIQAGDSFKEQATYCVNEVIKAGEIYALIYSDEDVIDLKGKLSSPLFKPDFNLDMLISINYIGCAALLNVQLLKEIGGFASYTGEHAFWGVYLRFILRCPSLCFKHITIPLYSCFKRKSNFKLDKEKIRIDFNEVLKDYSQQISKLETRVNVVLDVSNRIKFVAKDSPLVSIIIPTRDRVKLLKKCINGLFNKTSYKNFELIIIDNGSSESKTLNYLAELKQAYNNIKIIREDSPFNYAALNNLAASFANGEILAFLNNDLEVIDDNWLEELVAETLRRGVGCVAPLLLYPNKLIQHAGVVMGLYNLVSHPFWKCKLSNKYYKKYGEYRRNYSALSAACLLVRKDVFQMVGGFDEKHLAVAYNDVDLSLKIQTAGYRNVFTPYVRLFHHESASRGKDNQNNEKSLRLKQEAEYLRHKWQKFIYHDPAYNPNLNLNSAEFTLALKPRVEKIWQEQTYNRSGFCYANLRQELDPYLDESNFSRIQDLAKTSLKNYTHKQLKAGLSVLIVTKDSPQLIIPLVNQLLQQAEAFKQAKIDYEIILGDTGSTDLQVLDFYQQISTKVTIKRDLSYHFSKCNNALQREASCEVLLLLNNDIILPADSNLLFNAYSKLMQEDDLGALGAVLHYPDGTIQHMGCSFLEIPEMYCVAYHVNHKQRIQESDLPLSKTYLAVTGAFLMVKHELYAMVGGLDEEYAKESQDVALCLELLKLGFRSKCFNLGHIIHIENGTRPKGEEFWPDRRRFTRKYMSYIKSVDVQMD